MIFTPASTSASAASCALVGRDGEDADDDVLVAADLDDVVDRADREVADGCADLVRVVVEDRRDRDAVLGEDRRARHRAAEAPGADEGDVVLALRAQDLANLVEQASVR